MCFGGGGGGGGPQYVTYDTPQGHFVAESGVPMDYVYRGAKTVAQYQQMAEQDLSDKQIAAQKDIADQQNAFNQQQLDWEKQQADQAQKAADDQAARQQAYDTGRSQLLQQGSDAINTAFAKFSPDYFTQYASDYMKQATDQIQYQQDLAQKQLAFGMARQGLSNSQAAANEQGLLQETAGRATAEQTQNAQEAANQLKSNVASAKGQLMGQVQNAESVAPPIAAGDMGSVTNALQTQGNQITGITNTAGDVTASLSGVPTVSPLADIFSGVLSSAGSYLGGANQNRIGQQFGFGLSGTSPSSSSVSLR